MVYIEGQNFRTIWGGLKFNPPCEMVDRLIKSIKQLVGVDDTTMFYECIALL